MNLTFNKIDNAPLRTVVKVALVILGSELSIMLAMDSLFIPSFGQSAPPFFWEILDPILLTIIVAPVLHFSVLRPMREQQIKLEQQKEELGIAAVTFDAQEGIIVTDANRKILKVNDSFTAMTGYRSEEAVGKTTAILHSGRQDKEFYQRMWEILKRDKYWEGEVWNRRKNGEIYPERLTITAVTGENKDICYVGIFSDITQRKAAEEKISFLAYHDQLTALPNRELFYDRLSQAMSQARRKCGSLALLFLDLDGFKAINDNYGHEAGDNILKTTANRLLASIRKADTVARLGGDEFAVVLYEIEKPEDVAGVSEKIIQKLTEPVLIKDTHECGIGVSIGIAIYPEDGAEIDSLMSAADSAMYESKAGGKRTYTFFTKQAREDANNQPWIVLGAAHLLGIPEIDQQHSRIVSLLNKLNAAVKKNEAPEVIARLFDDLIALVRAHFKTEDCLMEEHEYLGKDAHVNEHQRLVLELGYLKEKFILGSELLVLQSLKDWLLNHVLLSDKQLADFLAQQADK